MPVRLKRCNRAESSKLFLTVLQVKHCKAEFCSQHNTCFRTEETHGQRGSPCQVARPSGQLTSRKQLGATVRKTCAVVLFISDGYMYFTPTLMPVPWDS
jgi:hypothetical protein